MLLLLRILIKRQLYRKTTNILHMLLSTSLQVFSFANTMMSAFNLYQIPN